MIVCHCHRVTEDKVESVLAAGAGNVRGVVRATSAGSGCGGCIPMLRELCRRRAEACTHTVGEALAG